MAGTESPEVVWRDGAWCSGCQQPARQLVLDAERMLRAARNGGWSARYGSVAEREHLRQAVYRIARARGLEVTTRSEGGRVGVLHVRATGTRSTERRARPPRAILQAAGAPDDPADLEAVLRELRRQEAYGSVQRTEASGAAAIGWEDERGPTPEREWFRRVLAWERARAGAGEAG